MEYTIAEVSNKTGLTTYTLRYYEKEGLLPFITRDDNGNRVFNEDDIKWLKTINCLKNTGMSIKKIKEYINMSGSDKSVLTERLEIMNTHKNIVEKKMNELKNYMDHIEYKIRYFEDKIDSLK